MFRGWSPAFVPPALMAKETRAAARVWGFQGSGKETSEGWGSDRGREV